MFPECVPNTMTQEMTVQVSWTEVPSLTVLNKGTGSLLSHISQITAILSTNPSSFILFPQSSET